LYQALCYICTSSSCVPDTEDCADLDILMKQQLPSGISMPDFTDWIAGILLCYYSNKRNRNKERRERDREIKKS